MSQLLNFSKVFSQNEKICDQDCYAIFDAYEVFILCGRNVLMPTGVPERITKDDQLASEGSKEPLVLRHKTRLGLYEISRASRNS